MYQDYLQGANEHDDKRGFVIAKELEFKKT